MVLTKDRTSEFYGKDYEIKIILDGDFNTFNDFREVFDFFTRFDSIYNDYKYADREYNPKSERTQVVSIKQGSLEIVAFIERHWFELLLVFLGNYKDIKLNVRQAYQDFDGIIDGVENTIKEIISDFPEYEIEQIAEIIKWFDQLTSEKKNRIIHNIRMGRSALKRIRKIILNKQ